MSEPKKFTILNLDLSAVLAEPVSHQMEVIDVPHRKHSPWARVFFSLPSPVHQLPSPPRWGT
jgi:hypothetical protein